MMTSKSLVLLLVALHCTFAQLSFGGKDKEKKADDSPTIAPRLGLLASSLGVPPVPGASYGDAGDSTLYSNGGGIQGGNGGGDSYGQPAVSPVKQCKCTPKAYCNDPGAQPGVLQPPVGPSGPGYNNNGDGQPGYPNPNQGNVQPGYPNPNQGNVEPGYPNPNQGGIEPGYPNPNQGGIDSGIVGPGQPGYSEGDGGSDGAGVIDIRIVNRPPNSGGVVCLAGEVYCCQGGGGGGGSYPSGPIQGGNDPYPASPGVCGVRQAIPVPGHTPEYGQALFGNYPWMAVMLGPNNNYLGAGALLDSYNVLTAAHKVKDYVNGGFKVRFGEWNAAADDEPYKNVEIEVARIDIHPAFNAQNLQNDVAIVRLAQPVSLDAFPHIRSACLPQQGQSFVGSRCWVAGFGKDAFQSGKHSYILREVDVPIIDSNECEQRLRGTRLGSYFNLNRKSFICAGGEEGKDACTGDGGSPLVCDNGTGKFSVVGLVAWGIGCADYGIPGVYVQVPSYINWIQSIIGNSGYGGSQPSKPAY